MASEQTTAAKQTENATRKCQPQAKVTASGLTAELVGRRIDQMAREE